jgi:hypothetical protein
MAVHLGTSALAGKMRMTPRASHPPAALAAPPVNAVCDALVIETVGGDVEGVAQRALTSLPLRAVDETTQLVVTAPVARAVAAPCPDGCVGGTCGKIHGRMIVPAAILAAMPPAAANIIGSAECKRQCVYRGHNFFYPIQLVVTYLKESRTVSHGSHLRRKSLMVLSCMTGPLQGGKIYAHICRAR